MKINVIVPLYAPPAEWRGIAMQKCRQITAQAAEHDWHFHFVNDGSPHISGFEKQENDHFLNIYFHSYSQNKGKGFAIRYGLEQSGTADIFMHSDWDFPFGIDILQKSVVLLKNADVVVANRGAEYLTHLPPMRQKITSAQRLLNKFLFRLSVPDTQAGFKAFNTEGGAIFRKTRIETFLFDTEFVILAEKAGLKIVSAEVICREGLMFKNFRIKVLLKELFSVIRLLQARYGN